MAILGVKNFSAEHHKSQDMVQATSYIFVPKPSCYEGAQICLKRGYFCWKLLAVFKTVLRYTKLCSDVDILNFLSSACYSYGL